MIGHRKIVERVEKLLEVFIIRNKQAIIFVRVSIVDSFRRHLSTKKKRSKNLHFVCFAGCFYDGVYYRNYQSVPTGDLVDPCLVRLCKDGVILGYDCAQTWSRPSLF